MNNGNTTPVKTQKAVSEKIIKKGKKEVEKKNKVLGQLSIEYVALNKLKPNEYNPNRQSEHDFELLLKSMEEDGFTQPIVAQKSGVIVDGEHRWRAASTLGHKEIPVVFVDMNDEQMRISTLRHNRARGSEDIELTAQVLKDLQELGAMEWAQDSLMMSDEEIDKLLEDIPAPEALAGEDWEESWIPAADRISTHSPDIEEYKSSRGQSSMGAGTTRVSDLIRERERRLKEAKKEEEKKMILEDTKIYNMSFAFTGEEADIVKAVLGKQPAMKLLEICRGLYLPGAGK